MRVLHVLPHRGGGGEVYVDMLERIDWVEHERFYLSTGRTPASGAVSIPVRWPALAARARRASLVHVHGDVASALVLPILRARPAVLTTNGLHMLRRARGPGLRLMQAAIAATAAACDAVICTSASELSELEPLVREPDRNKLRLIHNAVDLPEPDDGSARAALRAELGVASDAVLALFVGQLEPRKAPVLAAHAARRVRDLRPSFVLAIAGKGPEADAVRAAGGDAVRMLGYRTDVDSLLQVADVFIAPAEREGMSFALLQAMARGVAIVASDGPGNPEAVGDAGIVFPVGDERALASALVELIDDPGRRAALGAAARARASDEFSVSRLLAETDAIYRQALGRVTAPAPSAGGARA